MLSLSGEIKSGSVENLRLQHWSLCRSVDHTTRSAHTYTSYVWLDTKHDYLSSNGIKLVLKVGQHKSKLHNLWFDTEHDYLSSNGL
jgi:hypothetical protein